MFIDSVHPVLREELEADGWKCDWYVDRSPREIMDVIDQYEGIVIRSKFPVNKSFLAAASKLQFIARSGSGLENIDLEEAKKRGVKVIHSPEGNRDAVGEQALGMLLSLFQNLNKADEEVRQGIWDREGNRGIELKGRTVGIIGYGQMGSAFAQRLKGFDCRIIAYDKYKTNFGSDGVIEATLEELQREADVISFHVPWNEETHYYFNAEFTNAFTKPIYLINTSRGKVVQTSALVDALKSGKVLGACLDVLEFESSSFENSMPKDNPDLNFLLDSAKVILSPHVAGWTKESYVKLSLFLLEKIRKEFN